MLVVKDSCIKMVGAELKESFNSSPTVFIDHRIILRRVVQYHHFVLYRYPLCTTEKHTSYFWCLIKTKRKCYIVTYRITGQFILLLSVYHYKASCVEAWKLWHT